MTEREIFFLIICLISLICAVVSMCLWIKRKKDIYNLSQSVNKFIEKGEATDFSTDDNSFALLQNSISDLENLYKLEKSNTEKESKKNTQFISDISHQLKTPLAGLRLYCEMEHNSNPSEHTQKELVLIEKMENLIYKLLRLEKIKSDSYVMDFQFYNIKEIADEILTEFSPLFPNKKYKVIGDGVMRCDKQWIGEALTNLIKNASEHTADDGTVEITVSSSDKSAIVSVSDNGGGVDEQDLPKLFSRFHKTKNSKPDSAGIGLAITKAIVEKHHGTISAENSAEGLCVTMCFPHIDGYITI